MWQVNSFAKINLGLEIVGKRQDGYHLLKTIFQTIDLHDTLKIKENRTHRLKLEGTDKKITWGRENTVYRAWQAFNERYGLRQGFDVHVKKRIPAGAGLGGGSSNAGSFLFFLDHYYELHLSKGELIDLATGIGADVPFFIIGGTALAEGIGEILTPLPDLKDISLFLFLPEISVSTSKVFSRVVLTKQPSASRISVFLEKKDFSVLENQLEPFTIELFPEIGEIKEKMIDKGCTIVLMSGSGSALFGIADKRDFSAQIKALPKLRVQHLIGKKYYQENVLGCRQAVRHRSLEPRFGGSNPPTPVKKHE